MWPQNITNVHTAHEQIYLNRPIVSHAGAGNWKRGTGSTHETGMTKHLVFLNIILTPTQANGLTNVHFLFSHLLSDVHVKHQPQSLP